MRELAPDVWQLDGRPANAINVYVIGDVLWGWNPFLMRGGMREPPRLVNPDHELNRRSARRLAELQPALVRFGHGLPCRDTAAFTAAVSALGR